MERVQLPDTGTALYFCEYWCADKWIIDHHDAYPGVEPVEYDLHPRDCVYCAGCGVRIAAGSDCVLCNEGLSCPGWDWLMTDTAVQFGHALDRRGHTLSGERQAAAEFLVRLEPTVTGEELAEIILGGPPGLGPEATDRLGGEPEAA